jgi:hypothetical protein
MIRAQKFYKTLPSKITQAEQAWLASQPQPNTPQARFIKHPPDGSEAQRLLGVALQATYAFVDAEDIPNVKNR